MNSARPLRWIAISLGTGVVLYYLFTHFQFFGDVSLLGGILLLEILIACLWKYDEFFFLLLMIMFVWAGLNIPLQSAGTRGRWVVLMAGAVVGYMIWLKHPRRAFGPIHLLAFFCICAAFVSATVSSFLQMASLKALSLLLLFTYCASGARLAVLSREDRFFRGLVLACEIGAWITAFCYLGLGNSIFGNPNSLGAAMSIGLFPVLLWGWLTADGPVLKARRLAALLLCIYLVFLSLARAGMISVAIEALIFCFCLHQYKLMVKVTALILAAVAITGMLDPSALRTRVNDLADAIVYKGHRQEGLMASRRTPWEMSIATIKEHPLFGTGYGTSPTGEDPGLSFGTVNSSSETSREHGSSYMTIAEWVGLLGVVPFVAILVLTVLNVIRVCLWMNRTADPHHYSIPLAMVVLSGLIHASFEDWLFAVGSYPCVYFWVFSFMLADLVPVSVVVPGVGLLTRVNRPVPTGFGAAVPNR